MENLNERAATYRTLGFKHLRTEEVPTESVRVAFFDAGEAHIELLEATSKESAVGRFIQKRGEGVHHLAFRVTNIDEEVKRLKSAGVKLIEPAPRPGAGGTRVAFIHPSSNGGVLMELVEPAK